MPVSDSKLRSINIIPWDIGISISSDLRRSINRELQKYGWRRWSQGNYCRKGGSVYYIFFNKQLLTLDFFDDGYSIFSIHNRAVCLDQLRIIDPVIINFDKQKTHRDILQWKHASSVLLKQTMESIWYLVSPLRRRISANSSWENHGLSYVFSFYLLRTTSADLRTKDLSLKFQALLFPIQISHVETTPEIDQSYSLRDHTFYEKEKVDLCTIIETPHKKIYFSWATSIFAYASSSSSSLEYCKMMRELQHGWFSAYVVDQRLNEIVEDLPHIDNVEQLIKLDRQMSCAVREITRLTSISNSMATNLQLRVLRVGAVQSGIADLASSMQTKLQFIRNEIASRFEAVAFRTKSPYGEPSRDRTCLIHCPVRSFRLVVTESG